MNALTRIWNRALGRRELQPSLPEGERVYAIGDIHGHLSLFEDMIARIEADDAAREPADTTVILLGDLVDRGPDSAGVIAAARDRAGRRRVRMLAGNHEEMFLRAFADETALRHFLRAGGRETLQSYFADPDEYRALALDDLLARMPHVVPAADLALMRGMEDLIRIGDYVFVHAGIDPSRPLDGQRTGDTRWIREPFLSHPDRLDVCVVHGHTIRSDVVVHAPRGWPNRIGIDTGAYQSGKLTAIGLQGTERWFMETRAN
ncbi:metallophosphoesterase [Croceicoccus sp. BE223]|uniref:metallophosphoesterase n=1 Tax=Croceicoccus sp. BE223 TaxID=2817716 RepID=UPI00286736C7|nr:metallophosphoesterase [Croceicoccus sp. BE223]MDR7101836.1 serine/threonine protein phosphatase 1 [Croceicoccus sp. BE223]